MQLGKNAHLRGPTECSEALSTARSPQPRPGHLVAARGLPPRVPLVLSAPGTVLHPAGRALPSGCNEPQAAPPGQVGALRGLNLIASSLHAASPECSTCLPPPIRVEIAGRAPGSRMQFHRRGRLSAAGAEDLLRPRDDLSLQVAAGPWPWRSAVAVTGPIQHMLRPAPQRRL